MINKRNQKSKRTETQWQNWWTNLVKTVTQAALPAAKKERKSRWKILCHYFLNNEGDPPQWTVEGNQSEELKALTRILNGDEDVHRVIMIVRMVVTSRLKY